LAAAVITTAITVATAGAGTPLAIALIGAALDFASTALDTAAMATGRTQINDPLNIASLTLGATGLLLGGTGVVTAFKAARGKGPKAAAEGTGEAVNETAPGPDSAGGSTTSAADVPKAPATASDEILERANRKNGKFIEDGQRVAFQLKLVIQGNSSEKSLNRAETAWRGSYGEALASWGDVKEHVPEHKFTAELQRDALSYLYHGMGAVKAAAFRKMRQTRSGSLRAMAEKIKEGQKYADSHILQSPVASGILGEN
ncbi:hypothetical protein, partial [Streptomyces sp. NPDC008121]|uniref:hypothetical protein n=1 Tax=Streptomyces sp. NPDC008121 TaxID=3364809 RepID=UPI0036E9441A